MMLTISEEYSWTDMRKHYLEESGDRNIMWILKTHPEINKITESSKMVEYLEKIFKVTSVGKKLLLFNLYFVNQVIGDDKHKFIRTLDNNYGFPTDELKTQFQTDISSINGIETHNDFYKRLDIYAPNNEILAQKNYI